MTAPLRSRWNGSFAASVGVGNRGLHYGDGVFRTVLLHGGVVAAAEAQLERLAADAAVLGLDSPSRAFLLAELAAVADLDEASIKLMLIRVDSGRGYRPQTHRADLLLLAYPPPQWPVACAVDGIIAMRSPVTMAPQPLLAGIKHLNRLEQVLASRDWPLGVDEAILAGDRGEPVCGTRSNLFWVRDGRLHTPALDRCGVAGVTRGRLLGLAAELGIDCQVGGHSWASLLAADEAFVCNSLNGIWPLRRLEQRDYPTARPLTRRLQMALAHPYSGQ